MTIIYKVKSVHLLVASFSRRKYMSMTKNKILVELLAVLTIAALLLAGCDGGNTTSPNTTTTTADRSKTTSGDTLGEILGRAQNTVTMKYDMVVTMPGFSVITRTTWVKKNKMRIEMSTQEITTVLLTDQDTKTMYSYMPAQNIAMKVNYDQVQKSAAQEAGSIADYNPKNLGTESIDGKACLVVEYSAEQATTKMWIWKDRGLPVKEEITSTEGKTIIDYKNYDFSDIPDSMFELPSGVRIMQTGGEGIETPAETTSPATTTPTTTDTSKSTKTTSEEEAKSLKPIFELLEWKIAGADSYVIFSYKYRTTDPSKERVGLEISLIGPEGNLLNQGHPLSDYSSWTTLSMTAGGFAVPKPGQYKLIVKTYKGDVIFEKILTLSEAKVRIENISPKWYYSEYWGNSLDYARIDFANDGDLPVYITNIPISVGGTQVTDGVVSGWIEHGNEAINVGGYSNVWVGGKNILRVAAYSSSGWLIAEKQIEIILPHKTK